MAMAPPYLPSKATYRLVRLVMLLLLVRTSTSTAGGTQVPAKSTAKHLQSSTAHRNDLHAGRSSNPEPLSGGGIGEQFVERCTANECLGIQQNAVNNPNSMFDVQIINLCITCTICHAHAYCPDFASTISVDPDVFIKISSTLCRINGGHAIRPGRMLLFSYGASFQTVIQPHSSVKCSR